MRNLSVVLFVLLFAAPALAITIGDIDMSLIRHDALIQGVAVEGDTEGMMRSAAFRYSSDIKVVIAVVSLNLYVRRWEYESVRYLKDGRLWYWTWDAESKTYVETEVIGQMKKAWTTQLKKFVDGI